MASNVNPVDDENLKVTITDVPSGSTSESYNPTADPVVTKEAKIVDVDENLNVGSLNLGYQSWWGSLVKVAKEKSKEALELIKTDLVEFKTTMASDTNTLLTQITNINLANNALINNLNNAFSSSEENADTTTRKPSPSSSSTTVYDRYLNELKSLQSNQNTYLVDPNDETQFNEFKNTFDSDSYKSVISDLLIDNSAMRLLYSQLVPAQISNNLFWARYFYKVNQLEEENKKRVKLLERATESTNESSGGLNTNSMNRDEVNDWGEDFEENEQDNNENDKTPTPIPNEKDENVVDDNQIIVSAIEESKEEKSEKNNESEKLVHNEETDKKRASLKPEESDEWEKVSKASEENSEPTATTVEVDEDIENVINQEEKNIKEVKSNKESSKNNNEWDEWDE